MRSDIQSRFTDRMLAELAGRYGQRPQDLTPLDGFESFIYRFEADGEGAILRVGHSERRDETYVRGEVDWLNFLAAGGASVAGARHSQRGELVETIDDGLEARGHGARFIAAAFDLAPGVSPGEFGWSPALYRTYGRMLGRLHALTQDYHPSDPNAFRPAWDHPSILDVEGNLRDRDPVALEKFQTLEATCRALPKPADGYGLVHFDAHGGNFLVQNEHTLTLFDFDDCNYNWFAYDLAIVLFYMVMWESDKLAFTRQFLKHFLEGYRQEFRLDPAWLETIPMFMKMREIDLYAVIARDFDLDNLDDPWVAGFMDGRVARIHADLPVVDLDFSEFAQIL